MGSSSDSQAPWRGGGFLTRWPVVSFFVLVVAVSAVFVVLSGDDPIRQVDGGGGDMPALTAELEGRIEYDPSLLGPREGIAPPPDAVTITPSDDASSIIAASPAGTTFYFTAGVHRGVKVEGSDLKDGMEFIGEFGAVLNGSEVLTGWVQDGSLWKATRPYTLNPNELEGEVCLPDHPRCDFLSDLFLDDQPLLHVASPSDVTQSGRWYYDDANGVIYMWDNPTGRTVEITNTRWAISTGEKPSNPADNVVVRNLVVEKYGPVRQRGAVHGSGGQGWLVENCDIRLNHSGGLNIGAGGVVQHNRINQNGQKGMGGGSGADILVENNEIAYNNYAGYDPEWEAGATKFVGVDGLTVRHNYVHDNKGAGLWADIDNDEVLFEYNVVDRNDLVGLYLEISYSGVIRYNLSRDNYYAGAGAGISISTSGPAEVYGNEILVAESRAGVPTHGIHVINSNRGASWDYDYVNIHDNTIVLRSADSFAVMWWLDASKPSSQALVDSCNASQDDNTYYIPTGHSRAIFTRPSLSEYSGVEANLTQIREFCNFEQGGRVTRVSDPAAALTTRASVTGG